MCSVFCWCSRSFGWIFLRSRFSLLDVSTNLNFNFVHGGFLVEWTILRDHIFRRPWCLSSFISVVRKFFGYLTTLVGRPLFWMSYSGYRPYSGNDMTNGSWILFVTRYRITKVVFGITKSEYPNRMFKFFSF